MTLPTDPTLTKLRILRARSAKKHAEAIEKLQSAEYAARLADEALQRRFYERCAEIGYCMACEVPLAECPGHVARAGWIGHGYFETIFVSRYDDGSSLKSIPCHTPML